MRLIRRNRVLMYLYWRLVMRKPRLQRALMRLLIRNRDVDIELFGARLRANTRAEVGYVSAHRVQLGSRTLREDPAVLLSLALILSPTDTFVDIGANVGLFSATLVKISQLHPGVRFYAFEANVDTAKRLRESLAATPVTVFDVALSNRKTTLEFSEGATSGVFGVRNQGSFQLQSTARRVDSVRLDTVDLAGDSLILKIDVEGHELEVLEGASGLFHAGRIKAVYLDGYRGDHALNYLGERGFMFYDGRTLKPGIAEFHLLALRDGLPPGTSA